MDVDTNALNSLKGGGGGRGKGFGPKGGCYHCGGPHYAKDCPRQQPGQRPWQHGGHHHDKTSKGKDKNFKGGKGKAKGEKGSKDKSKGKMKGDKNGKNKKQQASLENDVNGDQPQEETWPDEASNEWHGGHWDDDGAWSMGALTLGSLDEMKVRFKETVDISSVENGYEWVKMNLDSGAGVTSFPVSWGPEKNGDGRKYKTASGEIIEDGGGWEFLGYDENDKYRSIGGRLMNVHKALCSAGVMAIKGRQDFFLSSDGGWIIPRDSKIGWEIRKFIDQCVKWYGNDDLVPLYLEDNVYNFYMKKEVSKGQETIDAKSLMKETTSASTTSRSSASTIARSRASATASPGASTIARPSASASASSSSGNGSGGALPRP
jgi:uncharacterized Fe-S cluster protein YjdI